MRRLLLCVLPFVFAAACSSGEETTASQAESRASASASVSASKAADVAAGFVGRWLGPDDRSLEIVARQHDYEISLMGVVGSGVFTGTISGTGMNLQRNGRLQTIRHVTGPQTAVPSLADKRDCVIIEAGEGFCRD